MREELARWANAIGARAALERGRDRLVDLLTGETRSPEVRRNAKDDRNLRLLIRFLLKPDSNCLDVGGSRGKFLSVIQQTAPRGHHIVYEPVPSLCEALKQAFPSMDVRQRALSDHEGESSFIHVVTPGYQGYSRLEEYVAEATYPDGLRTQAFTVQTERLDDHLPRGWLPDFVKIDVEGAELPVLYGAVDTLRRARPFLAFEHGWHGEKSEEIHKLVCDEIGLRIFDMNGLGPYDRQQFMERLGSRWNWIAHA